MHYEVHVRDAGIGVFTTVTADISTKFSQLFGDLFHGRSCDVGNELSCLCSSGKRHAAAEPLPPGGRWTPGGVTDAGKYSGHGSCFGLKTVLYRLDRKSTRLNSS